MLNGTPNEFTTFAGNPGAVKDQLLGIHSLWIERRSAPGKFA